MISVLLSKQDWIFELTLCGTVQEGAGQGPVWSWGASQIPRGDLQTTFLFKGFDEARRLGLNRDTEANVRTALAADSALSSTSGSALPWPVVMLHPDPTPDSFVLTLCSLCAVAVETGPKVNSQSIHAAVDFTAHTAVE